MKKTYISPEILFVELRCKVNMLAGSLIKDDDVIITTQADGSWSKEYSTVSDVNVWDNEW